MTTPAFIVPSFMLTSGMLTSGMLTSGMLTSGMLTSGPIEPLPSLFAMTQGRAPARTPEGLAHADALLRLAQAPNAAPPPYAPAPGFPTRR